MTASDTSSRQHDGLRSRSTPNRRARIFLTTLLFPPRPSELPLTIVGGFFCIAVTTVEVDAFADRVDIYVQTVCAPLGNTVGQDAVPARVIDPMAGRCFRTPRRKETACV